MTGLDVSFALTQARRELRGGIEGFRVFLMCLFLGVAAIAAVGAVTSAFMSGLARESRVLLGGDLDVSLSHRPASEEESAFLAEQGQTSQVVGLRTMSFSTTSEARALVEIKGVDEAYPLFGEVGISPSMSLKDALADNGALVEDTLLTRLNLAIGEQVRIGATSFTIRGVILDEPDRVAGGFRFGPRVMVSANTLQSTGLIQLGSMIQYRTRIALEDGNAGEEVLSDFKERAEANFPTSGWRIQDRYNSSPGVRFFIDRVSMFLTMVGLAALIVGGVGVGNAVKSYLDGKQEVIATFKCLGADGRTIFAIYFLQVMALAFIAIVLGLVVGGLVPFILAMSLGDVLPIPVELGFYPAAMVQAGLYGLLVTIGFTIWPLAKARNLSPARLFRELVAHERTWPGWRVWVALAVTFAGLVGTAVGMSSYPPFSAIFLAGVVVSFVLLLGVAHVVRWCLKRFGSRQLAALRLAFANLTRPGAPTVSVIVSMGLGLTLVVTVSLIEGNLSEQISSGIPEDAPAFFFIDIQQSQAEAFDRLMSEAEGVEDYARVANLRGAIVRINDVDVREVEVDPEVRWVLQGDRGLTYSQEIPEGSQVVAGEWWPADYSGPTLISMEEAAAIGLGVGVGDQLTMTVLGRELEAEIANLRRLEWQTPDFNYVIVFAPGTLEGAPHSFIGNVRVGEAFEEALYRQITDRFANVTVIRVKEALSSVNDILSDLSLGVKVTSMVTVLAGLLVLAGALAAGHRRRLYDAVVLKVLGAKRNWIIRVYVIEFVLMGLITAVLATGLGTWAAYLVITQAMDGTWVFQPIRLAVSIGVAVLVTVVLGLFGTWATLGAKPAPVLRSA